MKAQKYKGNGFPSGKWQVHSLDLDTWFQDQLEIRRRKGVKSWVTLSGLILINSFHIYYTFLLCVFMEFLFMQMCVSLHLYVFLELFLWLSFCLCCSILLYLFYLSSSSSLLLLYAYLYSNKRQKNGVGLGRWRHRSMLGLLRNGKP